MKKNNLTPPPSTASVQVIKDSRLSHLRLILIIITAGIVFFGVCYLLHIKKDNKRQGVGAVVDKEAHIPLENGQSWDEIDDPSKDGWDTEVLANLATKQLKQLGKLLANSEQLSKQELIRLISKDFECDPLRSEELSTIIDDKYITIERKVRAKPLQELVEYSERNLKYRGAAGLSEAIGNAYTSFNNLQNLNFKGKVFKIKKISNGFLTRQYISIAGEKKGEAKSQGKIELHTTWDVGWSYSNGNSTPKIRWIKVLEYEQTETHQTRGGFFTDCTESVLGNSDAYHNQFLYGMNHWFQRIQPTGNDILSANKGISVADVNGDGLDDLYICEEAGLPNRLYIQKTDGTAEEVSEEWNLNWLQSSRSAIFSDLDNDGDQDVAVSILGGVVIAENNGKGKFVIKNVLKTRDIDVMSLSAVDYNEDGLLDIFACVYHPNQELGSSGSVGLASDTNSFLLYDANNGGYNVLFQNEIKPQGSWNFRNVTHDVGLNINNHRYSLAASWDDLDNDGDLDLYVANDYGRDHLYRNDQVLNSKGVSKRRFVDISETAKIEDSATGMSISWADYDRDGWMDLFIANMWSSAGNRITYQNQFKPGASQDEKNKYQRIARGNTLFQNQGDGTFADHSEKAGIEMGRWAWGTNFVDLNNDGWEDVVIANGYITTEDTGDL